MSNVFLLRHFTISYISCISSSMKNPSMKKSSLREIYNNNKTKSKNTMITII